MFKSALELSIIVASALRKRLVIDITSHATNLLLQGLPLTEAMAGLIQSDPG